MIRRILAWTFIAAVVLVGPAYAAVGFTDTSPGNVKTGTSLTVAPPDSLASGDCWGVIIFADSDASVTLNTHADFDALTGHSSANGWVGRAYMRVATGGEGSKTFTVTGGSTYQVRTFSLRFTGCRSGTYNGNTAQTQPNSGNVDADNITIQDAGSAAVVWLGSGASDDSTIAVPSGLTTVTGSPTHGSFANLGVGVILSPGVGTYAPSTWTNTSVTPVYIQTFEVRESTGGGGSEVSQFYRRRVQ